MIPTYFILFRIPEKFGYDSKTLLYIDQSVDSVVNELNMMPLIAIVCLLCPK